jgi:hypothetical protein
MLYSSTSVRHTWPSGTAARLACHRILAPARQLSTLPAPTETCVQPLCLLVEVWRCHVRTV